MRNQGSLRLGYFPLPLSEARRIKDCLRYPTSSASTIDPCIGDGAAFLAITADTYARRYGIELDVYRAEQAASVVDELIHGDCLDVYCPVGSFGLAFLTALRLTGSGLGDTSQLSGARTVEGRHNHRATCSVRRYREELREACIPG